LAGNLRGSFLNICELSSRVKGDFRSGNRRVSGGQGVSRGNSTYPMLAAAVLPLRERGKQCENRRKVMQPGGDASGIGGGWLLWA